MTRILGVVTALLCSTAAVVLMLLPTYTTVAGVEGGARTLEAHSWCDPFLIAYLDVVPAVSLLCGTVMVAGLARALLRGATPRWVPMSGAVATLLLLFAHDVDGSGFVSGGGRLVAPLLATSSVLALVAVASERRSAAGPPSGPGGQGEPT